MIPEIKQRIEQIRRGEVPRGYKKTKTDIVPEEWERVVIGDYIVEFKEKTTVTNQFPVLTSSRNGLMLQTDYYANRQVTTENNIGYNILPRGYITFRSRSDDGRFRFNENTIIDKGIVSYFYPVFTFRDDISKDFILQLLNETIYRRMYPYAEGTAQQVLSLNKLCHLIYSIPHIAEQRKIVAVLAIQDKIIELQTHKIDELKKLKKAYLSKMFPKKGRKVPELRFKGYTDAWEQRKLEAVFDCSVSNNTLSRAELNYENGDVKSVHYGDVLIKYSSVLDAQVDEIPFITGKKAIDFSSQWLQDGDIIVADTAEDETTGKATEIRHLGAIPVVAGLHTIVCRPVIKMAPYYLGYYFNSDSYHGQLLPFMQGIKVLSLNRSTLIKTEIKYPKLYEEQRQIGAFFRSFDDFITLHQRKLNEMRKFKKTLMQLLLTGIVRVKR